MGKWVKYVTNDGYDWKSEMDLPDYPGPVDNSSLFVSKLQILLFNGTVLCPR